VGFGFILLEGRFVWVLTSIRQKHHVACEVSVAISQHTEMIILLSEVIYQHHKATTITQNGTSQKFALLLETCLKIKCFYGKQVLSIVERLNFNSILLRNLLNGRYSFHSLKGLLGRAIVQAGCCRPVGLSLGWIIVGQVSSEYIRFPCQFLFRQMLHFSHLLSGAGTMGNLRPK
jgi:hypothetical protein